VYLCTNLCIYIYIPVYVYVCDIYDMYVIYIQMHSKTRDRKCVYRYVYIYVRIHTYTRTHKHTHAHTDMHTQNTHTHTHMCTFTGTRVMRCNNSCNSSRHMLPVPACRFRCLWYIQWLHVSTCMNMYRHIYLCAHRVLKDIYVYTYIEFPAKLLDYFL